MGLLIVFKFFMPVFNHFRRLCIFQYFRWTTFWNLKRNEMLRKKICIQFARVFSISLCSQGYSGTWRKKVPLFCVSPVPFIWGHFEPKITCSSWFNQCGIIRKEKLKSLKAPQISIKVYGCKLSPSPSPLSLSSQNY